MKTNQANHAYLQTAHRFAPGFAGAGQHAAPRQVWWQSLRRLQRVHGRQEELGPKARGLSADLARVNGQTEFWENFLYGALGICGLLSIAVCVFFK